MTVDLSRSISGPALNEVLGLGDTTVRTLRIQGILPQPHAKVGTTYYYLMDAIDAALRAVAQPQGWQPPSIQQIIDEQDCLVDTQEARTFMGLSARNFRLRAGGDIPVLRVSPSTLRFSLQTIMDLAKQHLDPEMMRLQDAAPLLGQTDQARIASVRKLVASGRLVRAQNPMDGMRTYVTTASVDALLRATLPTFISVEDWKDLRDNRPCRLVPPPEAADMLQVSQHMLRHMHTSGELPYIRGVGGKFCAYLTPLCCIEDLNSEDAAYTAPRVAGLFGTTPKRAQSWIDERLLTCDQCSYLRRECLLRYVARSHNRQIDPNVWFEARRKGKLLTIGSIIRGGYTSLTFDDLCAALKSCDLPGLRLPGSSNNGRKWRVLESDVLAFEEARKK